MAGGCSCWQQAHLARVVAAASGAFDHDDPHDAPGARSPRRRRMNSLPDPAPSRRTAARGPRLVSVGHHEIRRFPSVTTEHAECQGRREMPMTTDREQRTRRDRTAGLRAVTAILLALSLWAADLSLAEAGVNTWTTNGPEGGAMQGSGQHRATPSTRDPATGRA